MIPDNFPLIRWSGANNNTPYIIFTRKPRICQQPCVVVDEYRILFSHGNQQDMFMLFEFIEYFLDRLQDEYPTSSFQILVWDYPTYGVSKEPLEQASAPYLYSVTDLLINTLALEHPLTEHARIFILTIGYSLGACFSAYLARSPKTDAIILLTPPAKLIQCSSKSYASSLVDDEFETLSHLQNKVRPELIVWALFMENDESLPPSKSIPLLEPYLDNYQCLKDFLGHNYFENPVSVDSIIAVFQKIVEEFHFHDSVVQHDEEERIAKQLSYLDEDLESAGLDENHLATPSDLSSEEEINHGD